MFISSSEAKFDSKGRVFLPVKYRAELGSRFYLTRGFDRCITVYPEKVWEAFCEKINSAPETRSGALRRYLFPMTDEGEIDSGGRILVSSRLREHAGIEKDAIIIGVGKKLEIWSSQIYNTDVVEAEDMDKIIEQLRMIEESI